jgi:hypothetical protein
MVRYGADVIDAHTPEMATRLAKQLTQIMRGAVAIGMSQPDALRLVIRCAQDSSLLIGEAATELADWLA